LPFLTSYPRALEPPAEKHCLREKHTEKENVFAVTELDEIVPSTLLLTKNIDSGFHFNHMFKFQEILSI